RAARDQRARWIPRQRTVAGRPAADRPATGRCGAAAHCRGLRSAGTRSIGAAAARAGRRELSVPRARTWLGRPGRSILGAPVQQLLRSSVMQAHQNYIAGEWVVAAAAAPNINPSNVADIVGEYARADEAQVRAAIAAGRGAFPAWSRGSIQARADALDKIGNEILARKEELGTLLSREEGKTKPEGIGEATRAGYLFKFFAGECVRLAGEMLPSVRPGIRV